MRILIGTYTRGTKSEGIYSVQLDPESGFVNEFGLFIAADNPSFLALHEDRLFVTSEVSDGEHGGELVVFSMAPEKVLLHQVVSSLGADPCHVAISDDRVAVANYSGGTFTLFEYVDGRIGDVIINPSQSRTGPHKRQQAAHPHGVYFIEEHLWVTDLGGDTISRYRADDGSFVDAIELPPGSGPRHLTPSGEYVVNELANTVIDLRSEHQGAPVSTLPVGWPNASATAEIVTHRDNIYVSNRGHNSIGVFDADLNLQQLQGCGGQHPRHFTFADSRWLVVANKDTDNIVVFETNPDGTIGDAVSEIACPSPTCVLSLA